MPEPPASDPETFPTARRWAEAILETRNRLLRERRRAFPPGTTRKCPTCGRKALESRDDLLREVVVGSIAMVHHNLHGARCSACGHEFLEAYEEVALEDSGVERSVPDYSAKVTSVSGKNLGTYWPKDVVRTMRLENQDSLRVQVLDKDTMILRRTHTNGSREN